MGSTSSVAVTPDGHIWVVDRCGANSCAGSDLAPISSSRPRASCCAISARACWCSRIASRSTGTRLWITDQGRSGKGDQVFKFSPEGKVLMTLGKAGVAGDGPDTFNQPDSVVIAPNGDVFISDGHNVRRGNARVMKLHSRTKFIKQWGGHGSTAGQFEMPHTLPSTRRGACLWRLRNNAFRFSTRRGTFWRNGSNSALPSGSASAGTMLCMCGRFGIDRRK